MVTLQRHAIHAGSELLILRQFGLRHVDRQGHVAGKRARRQQRLLRLSRQDQAQPLLRRLAQGQFQAVAGRLQGGRHAARLQGQAQLRWQQHHLARALRQQSLHEYPGPGALRHGDRAHAGSIGRTGGQQAILSITEDMFFHQTRQGRAQAGAGQRRGFQAQQSHVGRRQQQDHLLRAGNQLPQAAQRRAALLQQGAAVAGQHEGAGRRAVDGRPGRVTDIQYCQSDSLSGVNFPATRPGWWCAADPFFD